MISMMPASAVITVVGLRVAVVLQCIDATLLMEMLQRYHCGCPGRLWTRLRIAVLSIVQSVTNASSHIPGSGDIDVAPVFVQQVAQYSRSLGSGDIDVAPVFVQQISQYSRRRITSVAGGSIMIVTWTDTDVEPAVDPPPPPLSLLPL